MSFEPKLTEDGSFTFFNHELGEAFHSKAGAKLEAAEKFVKPCNIAEKARVNSRLCLLDICYGLGYNSAAALTTIQSINPKCCVELIALEIDLRVPRQAVDGQLLNRWPQPICRSLTALAESGEIKTPLLRGKLLLGDARKTIQQVLNSGFIADAIFLDPFSPPKCPQLWTVEFLQLVAMCLAPTGRLATYSCAAPVRAAIGLTGLKFGPTSCIGRRSPGTVAAKVASEIASLSQQELEHLNTRAAVPYRDPQLKDSPQLICQRRFAEQQASCLEPTTRWKKRWSYCRDSK